jgi:hypothetical protein
MSSIVYNNFEEFLKDKGIVKVESFDKEQRLGYRIITKDMIEAQLKAIGEFHNRTMGFRGYLSNRLENYTGKKVEECKVYLKKLKRDVRKLHNEGTQNHVEELILKYSDDFIKRAEDCITNIYAQDYYGLINRSMKRIEICIGDGFHTNLRDNGKTIELINIDSAGYNMIECDAVNYFLKLKKKGLELEWRDLISQFCDYEELGIDSQEFIISLVSFPHEFMRSTNRYRYRKKDWTEEEYAENLIDAVERDGESLL